MLTKLELLLVLIIVNLVLYQHRSPHPITELILWQIFVIIVGLIFFYLLNLIPLHKIQPWLDKPENSSNWLIHIVVRVIALARKSWMK